MCRARTIGTMREFTTKNFRVIADAIEDDHIDLSFDDTGDIAKGLDSGKFISFCARVRVFFHGREIGSEYLGSCIYKSLNDFMDHKECGKQNRKWAKQGKEGRCGSYFHDMIREAIGEARKTLLNDVQPYIRRART